MNARPTLQNNLSWLGHYAESNHLAIYETCFFGSGLGKNLFKFEWNGAKSSLILELTKVFLEHTRLLSHYVTKANREEVRGDRALRKYGRGVFDSFPYENQITVSLDPIWKNRKCKTILLPMTAFTWPCVSRLEGGCSRPRLRRKKPLKAMRYIYTPLILLRELPADYHT